MNVPKPTRRTRVLVVHDEVSMRKALTDALAEDATIEVVGTAARGSIAVAKAEQLGPDLVILDANLPDGSAEALASLRRNRPGLKVLVLVEDRLRQASIATEFLRLGVTDFAARPTGSAAQLLAVIREQILPQVQGLCAGFSVRDPSIAPPPPERKPREAPPRIREANETLGEIRAVLIAASTGGPRALDVVLAELPRLDLPILIVQHMPPVFTAALAQRMTQRCAFPVIEATSGEMVENGKCWVAPGGYHLAVARRGSQVETVIHQGPLENSVRPAADVLFRSAVPVWGGKILAVVLTGMGQDGLRGAEEIVRASGRVIVQDQATSVVWGMPGFIAQAGLADAVLPLPEIAREIVRRVSRKARSPVSKEEGG